MTSPREVIAEAVDAFGIDFRDEWPDNVMTALADAGYVIVPRPTEDQVEAMCQAYEIAMATDRKSGWFVRSAPAILAAAEAADTRPKELHDEMKRLAEVKARATARAYTQDGVVQLSVMQFIYECAALMVAEKYNLPEVNDGE